MSKLVNLCIFNHPAIVVSDFIDAFKSEFDSIGVKLVTSNSQLKNTQNIFIENFNLDLNKKLKNIFEKNDPNLCLLMTEIVKDGMLDSTSPGPEDKVDGWYDRNSDTWKARTEAFFDIIEYFGFVICASEEIYNSLKSLNLKSKLIYWRPKYHGTMANIGQIWASRQSHPKLTSLLFSGSSTPYRDQQINELRKMNFSVALGKPHWPNNVRSMHHEQSLLSFGPKHYRGTYQLSKMRLMWCLDHHYPILMERCNGVTDLDPYCVFYESVQDLVRRLERIDQTILECKKKNLQYIQDTMNLETSLAEILS